MLLRLLGVRAGDESLVLRLGGHAAVFLAATTIHETAGEALFLQSYAASRLPLAVGVGTLAGVLAVAPYNALRQRLRGPSGMGVVLSILASLLVLLCSLQLLGWGGAAFMLRALQPVYAGLLGFEVSRFRASKLDARAGRRLLPILGAMGGLGAASGAMLVRVLGGLVGPVHLLWVAAALILLTLIPSRGGVRPAPGSSAAPDASWSDVFRMRYVRLLAGIGVTAVVLQELVRYQFALTVVATLDPSEYTDFYGGFGVVLNVLSIVFSLVVSRIAISRLGVGSALWLYPLVMIFAAIVVLAMPTLAAVASGALLERLMRQNLHRPVSSVAAMPLVLGVRRRLGLAQRGVLIPAARALTSATLALGFAWQRLSLAILVVSVLLLLSVAFVRRLYVQELTGALRSRRLRLEDAEEEALGFDWEARKQLNAQLRSEFPERVSLALHVLRGHASNRTVRAVGERWDSWMPFLKVDAVKTLALRAPQAAPAFLAERFACGEEDPQVQAALLDTRLVAPSDVQLNELLRSDQASLCASAASLLVERDGLSEIQSQVEQWLSEGSEDGQRKAVAVIGRVGGSLLEDLNGLEEAVPDAVLEAYRAHPERASLAFCVEALAADTTYALAREVLVAAGDGAVPLLARATAEPQLSAAALSVLEGIQTAACRTSLLELLEAGGDEQRFRVARALARQPEEIALTGEGARIEAVLDGEIARCVRYYRLREAERRGTLVQREAAAELEWALERVFVLLSCLQPGVAYRKAFLSLSSSDARQRGFAVELIDEVLDAKMKDRVIPILEGHLEATDPEAGAAAGGDAAVADRTAEDPWLHRLRRSELESDLEIERARRLQEAQIFSAWRLRDLVHLAAFATDDPGGSELTWLRLRQGSVVDLERTVLLGRSPEALPGDLSVSLQAVYLTIQQRPACAAAWLKGLASRMEAPGDPAPDVTRTQMMSLASRTVADDHEVAEDLDVWRRMFFLRTLPLTQGLSPERLRLVAEIARPLQAAPGEAVVNEGRLGHHFYVVCTGLLEVAVDGAVVSQLHPSEAFGALSLLTGQRRAGSVRAVERSELLVVDRIDFLDLLDAHPALVRAFSRMVAERTLALGGV